jgi:hypothetical protein
MDWWVIAFAICLVVRWDSPSVPVRPIVAIQAWGSVAVAEARSATVPAVTTTGRAASYRVFATRSGTVLRYRQGTSTRQQYCRHHDAFKEGHVVSPTRRRIHRTGNVVTRAPSSPISTLRLGTERRRRVINPRRREAAGGHGGVVPSNSERHSALKL